MRGQHTVEPAAKMRRRSLAIRHVSGHRLVALVEIVSPATKDRARHVEVFTDKVLAALHAGVHVVLVDLLPPRRHDPDGFHGALLRQLEQSDGRYDLPCEKPLTVVSYAAGTQVEIYVEHLAIGDSLPEAPLFLRPDRYVNLPLESTYRDSYRGLPAFWREVLEAPSGVAAGSETRAEREST